MSAAAAPDGPLAQGSQAFCLPSRAWPARRSRNRPRRHPRRAATRTAPRPLPSLICRWGGPCASWSTATCALPIRPILPIPSPGCANGWRKKLVKRSRTSCCSPAICPSTAATRTDWKIYFQETALWTQERLRIYPTIGNHEGLPDPRAGLRNYFAAYPQIDHHEWYSVQLGNIYLITLDSSTFLDPGWTQRQLAGVTACPSSSVGGLCFLSLPHTAGL